MSKTTRLILLDSLLQEVGEHLFLPRPRAVFSYERNGTQNGPSGRIKQCEPGALDNLWHGDTAPSFIVQDQCVPDPLPAANWCEGVLLGGDPRGVSIVNQVKYCMHEKLGVQYSR